MRLNKRDWLKAGGAACLTSSCAPQGTPRAAADQLFLTTSRGLMAIDPSKGERRPPLPAAIPSPDWTRLYAAAVRGERTRLETLDAKTGAELAMVEIEGRLIPRVASRDRAWVALMEAEPGDAGAQRGAVAAWLPVGRARTTLVIADPSGKRAARRLALAGNYAPDAFSSDSRQLFVLEYMPALNSDRYRVRQIDLQTGQPGPLLTRFKLAPVAAEEEMRGLGRMQVLAPSASTLYTLYTKQDDHLHTRDYVAAGGTGSAGPMTHAFVHTLSLNEGWAYCLDLPMPFGVGPSGAHAIATSRDGTRLFVVDRSSGTLAVADTQVLELKIVQPLEMDATAAPGEAAMEVGPDGTLYLASGASVLAFARTGVRIERSPRSRWVLPGTVRGLKLSQDGQRLYAGQEARVAILSAADGRELGRIDVGGVETISHVGWV
ncbi:MAG TPA: hypothetical protein VFX49_17665 [Chloroflexota bacterium]|nr:hypothetical protein [Chloroflexota bacterium]